jgi:Flp pilus assembly pilin Flp
LVVTARIQRDAQERKANPVLKRPRQTVLGLVAFVHGRLATERGQTLAEYGLIVTLVAVAVVLTAMIVFREALAAAFNSAADCMNGSC